MPGFRRLDKQSDGEATFAYYLRVLGRDLPAPVTEYVFEPTRKWRLDFAWPDLMLAVEIEGMDHRKRERYASDLEKYNALSAAGWTLMRVTMRLVEEDPDAVMGQLRVLIGNARGRGLRRKGLRL